MKHLFFLFIAFVFFTTAKAQDHHLVDSLKTAIKEQRVKDTNTVKSYYRIAANYGWNEPDSSIHYDKNAIALSRKLHFIKGEFQALNYLAFLLAIIRSDSAALSAAYRAVQISEDEKRQDWLSRAYLTLGSVYMHIKQFDKGILYHRKCLVLLNKEDSMYINGCYQHFAQCYLGLNETDSAFFYAKKVLAYNQQHEVNSTWDVYQMGSVYYQKNEIDTALQYYKSALKTLDSQRGQYYAYKKDIADCNIGIAHVFEKKHVPDSTVYYAKAAWNVSRSTGLPNEKLEALNLLASGFAAQSKLDSAYTYQNYALGLRDSIYNADKVRQAQLLSFNEDLRKQQEQEEARKHFTSTIIIALIVLLLFAFIIVTIVSISNKKRKKAYALLQKQKEQIDNKNRELEIEAALERVRSRAMAMQKSEELREVVQVIFDQLCGLDFKIESASFAVEINETNDWRSWLAAHGNQYASRIDVPYLDHPVFNRPVEAKEKGETFYKLLLTKEEKDRFFDHYFKFAPIPEDRKPKIYDSKGWAQSVVLMNTIGLSIINYAPLPYSDKQNKTLVRFGKAFEQVYTRFLDLQKAEAQAREAQIEAALERVRSRTMGMQKSDELREVIQLVLDQLCGLHFPIDSASFTVEFNESNDFRIWLAAPGQQYPARIDVPYLDHPIFNRVVEAKEKGETFYTLLLTKEEKDRFFDHFFKYAPVTEERRKVLYSSAGWAMSSVLMKTVALTIYNYSAIPYSEEQNNTLLRFGKGFEQTYTRFLDLQKAEANAREAVKQASVDRVRGEIASMRTTTDLEKITPLIWNELKNLQVPFIRCGVFIMDKEKEQIQVYLSTPDGKAIASFQLPDNSKGIAPQLLSNWQNNRPFIDHWDAATFSEWTKSLVEEGAIQADEKYSAEKPPDNLYLHFLPFLQGMLYVGNGAQLKEDEMQLVQSLANSFATAYARYEDFNKLENAKQQVDIALKELRSTQQQLIQSEKMASLGELTAGIAHEIQNPLNFVNNFSDVNAELIAEMKEEIDKGNIEEVKAIANDIEENEVKINHHGKRADAIVKGMLQHSRTNSGKKEVTDINSLVDEYLRLSYHGLRAKDEMFNSNFTTDFDDSMGSSKVIPQDIGRVLLNLFNNAFYSVNEKKKQLNGTFQPAVSVSTRKSKDTVEIRVKDNGNGIPEKVVDKIFQPFFTTKPTGQGTGLGLSLSYDIIKAHGGELRMETVKSEGAEFIVLLPLK